MHGGSGVRLKIVKAQLQERFFEPGEEASFRITVKNLGSGVAEEVIGVVTSDHERLRVLTEMLRFGNIRAGEESSAVLQMRSEHIPPGKYTMKVVLSAVGVAAAGHSFLVDIVEGGRKG